MSNPITAAEEIVAAAKTNDCERLIRLLTDENPGSNLANFRKLQNGLSPLETAMLTGHQAANILACYEVLGKEYIKDKKPHEIVATKSVWCRCLSNSVASRKNVRGRIDMRANVLSGSYAFIGREEGNSPFYTIVRDHYSKLLTPFEAIERPASFMALMRLDDNFKILSPEGLTLPMFILQSKKIKKCFKRALLQFIAHFDEEILYVPSGSEGLTPAAYCLKTNNVFLFRELGIFKNIHKFRSAYGRDIMHYCNNFQLRFVGEEERKKLFTECDGALNTFLIRNMTSKQRDRFHDSLALAAIESLAKKGKESQLKEFAQVVDDKALAMLMAQLGFKGIEKFKSLEAQSSEKQSFKTDPDLQTTFDFMNLPSDMTELIMAELTARDILNLFIVSKMMREQFKRFDSNALWLQVLRNTKLTLDGDFPTPANDLKNYVLTNERCKENWRKGRFGTKTLVTIKEYGIYPSLLDDNWVCCAIWGNKWVFYNMNTGETINNYMLFGSSIWVHSQSTFIESPPLDPPLIAEYTVESALAYGRPGKNACKEHIQLPPAPAERPIIFAQSIDRVVVGTKLRVVDLPTKSVVATIEKGLSMLSAVADPFNRSMSIGANDSQVMIFDKDMSVVQLMQFCLDDFAMIDEFTLCGRHLEQLVLFDIRKFHVDSTGPQVLLDNIDGRFSIDVRNQRALVTTGPYRITAQIDLQTRQMERVYKDFPWTSLPRINDKYMIFSENHFEQSRLMAYDFTI